jgi:hypothetical protein
MVVVGALTSTSHPSLIQQPSYTCTKLNFKLFLQCDTESDMLTRMAETLYWLLDKDRTTKEIS